jgi:hypothetical protein
MPSCRRVYENPFSETVSYTGSGFEPGRQIDILLRGADEPRGSGNPLGPGGVTRSFSRSAPYRGGKRREVVVEVDRIIPPVEGPVGCPVLGG